MAFGSTARVIKQFKPGVAGGCKSHRDAPVSPRSSEAGEQIGRVLEQLRKAGFLPHEQPHNKP